MKVRNITWTKRSDGFYNVKYEYKTNRMRTWKTDEEEVGGKSLGSYIRNLRRYEEK